MYKVNKLYGYTVAETKYMVRKMENPGKPNEKQLQKPKT